MEKFINPDKSTWNSLTKRASVSYDSLEPIAKVIFKEVEKDGDVAISAYTYKFDNVKIESNVVSPDEISSAIKRVPDKLKIEIQKSKNNIEALKLSAKTMIEEHNASLDAFFID